MQVWIHRHIYLHIYRSFVVLIITSSLNVLRVRHRNRRYRHVNLLHVNQVHDDGFPPLFRAAWGETQGHTDAVKALVAAGNYLLARCTYSCHPLTPSM